MSKTKKFKKMTLTDLARYSEVNLQTVRYYIRVGLINPPKNEFGKYVFDLEQVDLIKFIKQSQSLGFSLKEIDAILKLKLKKNTNCSPIKKKIHQKTHEIEEKIIQLKNMHKLLKNFERKCNGNEQSANCSILDEITNLRK